MSGRFCEPLIVGGAQQKHQGFSQSHDGFASANATGHIITPSLSGRFYEPLSESVIHHHHTLLKASSIPL